MVYTFTQEKLKETLQKVYQLGVQDFFNEMLSYCDYPDSMIETRNKLLSYEFMFKEDGGLL